MLNKLSTLFFVVLFFFSCNLTSDGSSDIINPNNSDIKTETPDIQQNYNNVKVSFYNESTFRCKIYLNVNPSLSDTETQPIADIQSGETVEVMLPPSVNKDIGDVFYIRYYVILADANETENGESIFIQAEKDVNNIAFVLEEGNSYKKTIIQPESNQLRFFDCYIRIYNKQPNSIQIHRGTSLLENMATEEFNLHSEKKGIYKIEIPPLYSSEEISALKIFNINTAETTNVPKFTISRGYIYDFVFTNEDETSYIIFDKKQKIKSVPTTKYLQTVVENQNELIKDTDLNNFLNTDLRLSLSDYHYQYPISKVIVDNEKYISASSGFSFFDSDSFEQVVDRGKPKEVALLVSKDFAWQTEKFSLQSLYAGTETIAYQTIYNDLINVNNDSFVALSTYAKDNRTGIWLYFLNSNGELTNEIDIPSDDTSAYEGYKLLSCSDGGFLSIGRIRNYNSIEEEYSSSSEFIVQKYFNQELQWQTKYSYSGVESEFISNSALCAVELENEYLVCGFTMDDFTTKTLLVKLDKTSGAVITSKSFGTGSDFFSPHAITSDDKQNVYISGLVSETETETKAFILKLDSNLEEIYLKKFGKAADNFLFDLQVKDNSLIAVGAVNTIEEYAFDYYYWQSSKGWILKIDAETGIVLNDFYSDKVSCFNSITKTEDDGFVLSAIKNVDKSNPYSFDTLIVKANENLEF